MQSDRARRLKGGGRRECSSAALDGSLQDDFGRQEEEACAERGKD